MVNFPTITSENFKMDTSIVAAFQEIIEGNWKFNVFSAKRGYIMEIDGDELFAYFVENYPHMKHRVFYGRCAFFYNDSLSIRFDAEFMPRYGKAVTKRYDDDITVTGVQELVQDVFDKLDKHFADKIIDDHHNVEWISMGANGIESTTMPIKFKQHLYPEMYPIFEDPYKFIDDFLTSTANVLILMGPPGLGKSALINQIILRARKRTQVVYDEEVMKVDQLYSSFISRTIREDGGMMILEDSDRILSDRVLADNKIMNKLLNLSDGIIDTSSAKFIFSANLTDRNKIDDALTRPGRCFDIVEFRQLTLEEAERASKALGKELYDDSKKNYTVAEIFNGKSTSQKTRMNKVGFV